MWCAVVGEGGAGLGRGGWWCGERCDEVLVLKEDESRVRMHKKNAVCLRRFLVSACLRQVYHGITSRVWVCVCVV